MRVLKVTRLPRDKDAQVDITARCMAAIAARDAWAPTVQWLASHASLPGAGVGQLPRLFSKYVRRVVRFEFDPEDVELIRLPSAMARDIRAGVPVFGDCDDMAVLLSAMLGARGFATEFVVMATSPHRPEFRHVFTRAYLGRGRWVALDPSVSRSYDTAGLRTRRYSVPHANLPPMV